MPSNGSDGYEKYHRFVLCSLRTEHLKHSNPSRHLHEGLENESWEWAGRIFPIIRLIVTTPYRMKPKSTPTLQHLLLWKKPKTSSLVFRCSSFTRKVYASARNMTRAGFSTNHTLIYCYRPQHAIRKRVPGGIRKQPTAQVNGTCKYCKKI